MQDDKLFNLFGIAYEIAYNHDSLASFADRCLGAELRAYKPSEGGEEEIVHLDLGRAYRNKTSVKEFLFFLNQVQKEKDMLRVRNGAYGVFGSAIDEATDISTDQALIQYVKFVDLSEGKRVSLFLGIRDLSAQDATTIFETHRDSLAEIFDGDTEKMHKHHFTMGTDGCSSMIGAQNGVTAQFKEQNPRLISVWCHAHRWSLVVKDAANEIHELEEWQDIFDFFYRFFSRSVKRRKALIQAQEELGEEFLALICDIDTRWLSKGLAISRLVKIVFSLHKMLSNAGNLGLDASAQERVAELLKALESHYFLAILHGLDSILQWCNTVSCALQERNLTGTKVQTALTAFEQGLTGSWLQGDLSPPVAAAGNPIHNLCTQMDAKGIRQLDAVGGTYTFSGACGHVIEVTCSEGDHTRAMNVLRRFASTIIENKNNRMGDASEASLFDFLMPSAIPVDKKARLEHGDKEYAALRDKFCDDKIVGDCKHPAIYDKDRVNVQWAHCKEELAARDVVGKGMDKDPDVIADLFKDKSFRSRFPFVMFLYSVMLSLWLETAECERGFSRRTLIKTKNRASMKNMLLDVLMRLSMNGPSLGDKALVSRFLGEAIQQFKAYRARFPQRSSARVSRDSNKAPNQSALARILGWAEYFAAYGEDDNEVMTQPAGSLELPDVVRETPGAREARERAEDESERTALSKIGPYKTEQGWAVDKLPDDIPFPGVPELCKTTEKFVKQKDVACKFVDGWKMGKVHVKQETSVQKGSKGFFAIRVKGVNGWLLYDLKRDTYGQDWVLLSRC